MEVANGVVNDFSVYCRRLVVGRVSTAIWAIDINSIKSQWPLSYGYLKLCLSIFSINWPLCGYLSQVTYLF